MNAMHDDLPRPTKLWKYPQAEEIAAYIQKLKLTNPGLLELDGMTEGSLGFHLYIKFLREQGETHCADFLVDVAIYRVSSNRL